VLPTDNHDARTSERIEAFLEGPPRPSRRRQRSVPRRAHRPIAFDDPSSWAIALRREDVRVERYGRRATVMVLDIVMSPAPPAEGTPPLDEAVLVEPVIDAIRHEARETDHVVRVSSTRFQLLLPETTESDADHVVDRLRTACRDRLNGHGSAVRLRIESTTPGHGRRLADALDDALRRIEA